MGGKKRQFSPSRIAIWNRCNFLYYIKYVLNLDLPVRSSPHYMAFGSFFHAASAAYDTWAYKPEVHGVPETDWIKAVKRELIDMKLTPNYDSKDSFMLDALADEMRVIMQGGEYDARDGNTYKPIMESAGGYIGWRRRIQQERKWKIVSLEKRYAVDIGPCVIRPMPDGVIRDADGHLWVIERKTTTTKWTAGYAAKYRTNLQTTLELLAVEKYYNEPVSGVYILPLYYTRQRRKDWDLLAKQPLYRVEYDFPKPISKPQWIRDAAIDWLTRHVENVLPFHETQKIWQQNYNNCGGGGFDCDLYQLCWGKLDIEDMIKIDQHRDFSSTLTKQIERSQDG